MPKHTPGPWTAEKDTDNDDWHVWARGLHVPDGHRYPACCFGPDAESNSKLMAASPELLQAARQALEAILRFNADWESNLTCAANMLQDAGESVQFAIRKATGGEK